MINKLYLNTKLEEENTIKYTCESMLNRKIYKFFCNHLMDPESTLIFLLLMCSNFRDVLFNDNIYEVAVHSFEDNQIGFLTIIYFSYDRWT